MKMTKNNKKRKIVWFDISTESDMQNHMTASIAVLAAKRLMYLHDFNKAKELMDDLLEMNRTNENPFSINRI